MSIKLNIYDCRSDRAGISWMALHFPMIAVDLCTGPMSIWKTISNNDINNLSAFDFLLLEKSIYKC